MKQGFGFEKGVKKTVRWTVFSPRVPWTESIRRKKMDLYAANPSAERRWICTRRIHPLKEDGFVRGEAIRRKKTDLYAVNPSAERRWICTRRIHLPKIYIKQKH